MICEIEKEQKCVIPDDYVFDWNITPSYFQARDQTISYEDSDSDDEGEKIKLSKREKKELRAMEEKQLRQVEIDLLEIEKDPKTADQFDRLLLGQPNNSELWIKYMSFHLQATEFEKAKAVAQKALQTIDSRVEQEKFNVWIALLNFENLYGSKESLKSCFEEAARTNDSFEIHKSMLNIFATSEKYQEVEDLVNRMCRKFNSSIECWYCCMNAFLKFNPPKARRLLSRALTTLPKNEHITLITRFALLENQFGSPEEAQTLFEHILTSYPKRIDIWITYTDMLIKSNKIDVARQVLERACNQKLPIRKMKSLYRKRISLEEKYGTEIHIKNIKSEITKYISVFNKNMDK